MPEPSEDLDALLERARAGDEPALARLFGAHRDALRRMIELRLDRRLIRRVGSSDVLQDAYLDVRARFADYAANLAVPFFVWARELTLQRLVDVHRHHLGTQKRAVGREAPPRLDADGGSLADVLIGGLTTPTEAAYRSELKGRLLDALQAMEPIDREVVALRHFEQLSNDQTALVLGITRVAASQRYVRALKRLKDVLESRGLPEAP